MQYTGVEAVVEPITLEINLLRYPIVERILGEVIAVQFSRQIRIVNVVFLGYPRERGLGGRVDFYPCCWCRRWLSVA